MANSALVFGAYRPTGEMGKLANLLRDGRPRLTAEVIQTIATKRPRERLVTLARQGRVPNLKSQTHLWGLDLENDPICMTDIRSR
jgi:hypothetical protein